MPHCRHPSAAMERVARTWLQRIIYFEVYICTACGAQLGLHHPIISAAIVNNYRFIFSRNSRCVSCGSEAVEQTDCVYFLSKNPLGWMQWLAGAPLMECSPCGRQYFDWRAPRRQRIHDKPQTHDSFGLAALSRAIPSETQLEREPAKSLSDR